MLPSDLELAARRRYNAIGDTNWSSPEFWELIFLACQELARDALCIERTYTATTTISQQEYGYPTNTISIKRVTFDGVKLEPITMREDDRLTMNDSATTSTGTPQYYFAWNNVISLRPIPSAAKTLKIWSYNEPQTITTGSQALEVPEMFHMDIVNFILSEMYMKDKDANTAQIYLNRWEKNKLDARKWMQRKKRGDTFGYVLPEEALTTTYLGPV